MMNEMNKYILKLINFYRLDFFLIFSLFEREEVHTLVKERPGAEGEGKADPLPSRETRAPSQRQPLNLLSHPGMPGLTSLIFTRFFPNK